MSDGGKGSAQRPGKGYEDNYDRIFGKKKATVSFEEITKDNYDIIFEKKMPEYIPHKQEKNNGAD